MGSSERVEHEGKLKLYSFWRSSCAWRVRIALNLKGLDYEYKAVNLLKGEHFSPEFLDLNPLSQVPILRDGNTVVADSFAIIMYMEDKYPEHPLLPQNLQKRALNYQAANIVASNMQPFQKRMGLHIEEKLGLDEIMAWSQRHIKNGLAALEKLLKEHAGKYATGDEVALADVFLAPQIGAIKTKGFNIDMAEFPLLKRLNDAYAELPAFQNAVPEKQPDYPHNVES